MNGRITNDNIEEREEYLVNNAIVNQQKIKTIARK